VFDQLHRPRRALDQGTGGDHLADIHAGRAGGTGLTQPSVAVLSAQPAEGAVGDAGHRGEHDRRIDGVPTKPERGSTGSTAVMIPKLSAADQAGREVGLDLVEGHPVLGHRVTLTHGHGMVVQGVEVDCDAERCADLVLAAIAPADGAGVIEVDRPVVAQLGGQVLALGSGRRCATAAGRRPLSAPAACRA